MLANKWITITNENNNYHWPIKYLVTPWGLYPAFCIIFYLLVRVTDLKHLGNLLLLAADTNNNKPSHTLYKILNNFMNILKPIMLINLILCLVITIIIMLYSYVNTQLQ